MNTPHAATLLYDISVAVLGAAGAGVIASKLRLPLVLAYLSAGIILGPNLGTGIIESSGGIDTIAEMGLVLLMFILGLEIDIRKLLQAGRPVLVNGFTQFVGCAAIAGFTLYALGYRNDGTSYELTYLAVISALSSTLLVVKILSERRELDAFTSRITLGILVFQDLWAITFLALQPSLGVLQPTLIAVSLTKAITLVGLAMTLARYVLPWLLQKIAKKPELMLLCTLSWCLGVAGFAQFLDLSMEMGALIAGITVASYPYHSDMAAKVGSLRDFFITLFFVSLGLKIPVPTESILFLAVVLVILGLVTRLITVVPVLYALGFGNRASLTPALNLSQLSEFALVLASLGVAHGHISDDIFASTIIAVVTSFLISSLLLPKSYLITRLLNPLMNRCGLRDQASFEPEDGQHSTESPSIVVLGFFREASSLLEELKKRHGQSLKEKMLVVDFNPEAHKRLKKEGYNCKYADISHLDTLQTIGLTNEQTIICSVPDIRLKGTNNIRLLQNIRSIAPQAVVVMTADTKNEAIKLYELGAAYVFCPRIISAFHLADLLERLQSSELEHIKVGGLKFFHNWEEVLP